MSFKGSVVPFFVFFTKIIKKIGHLDNIWYKCCINPLLAIQTAHSLLLYQYNTYFPPASIILSVKCVKWLEMCQASHTSNGLVSVLNHVEYYDKQEQIL